MGCSLSKNRGERISILIRSASGLKNADYTGNSDPYCISRIGFKNSNWDEKLEITERCSPYISNTDCPEWNFATSYLIPTNNNNKNSTGTGLGVGISVGAMVGAAAGKVIEGAAVGAITGAIIGSLLHKNSDENTGEDREYSVDDFEYHIKIMDNDTFSGDDFLGEVRVPIRTLIDTYGQVQSYPITGGTGELVVVTGDLVNKAVEEKLARAKKSDIPRWIQTLQQYFASLDDDIVYSTTMIRFLLAGMQSDLGLQNWLREKGGENGVWNGPEDSDCKTYLKHADVYGKMKELPAKFGTNNENGMVERQNNLGFQKLNGVIWGELEKGNRVIGLGQTQENHAFVRKYISKVLDVGGNWSDKLVKDHVTSFFSNRISFSTDDFKTWTTILLHKIHFNMDLTWEEGEEFMKMQRTLLISIAPGESIMKNFVVRRVLGLDEAIEKKKRMLKRYIRAIEKMFVEVNYFTHRQKMLLVSNFMDSLLFAGGQSVPTVLSYCTGLLYSDWLKKQIPDFELTVHNLSNYIMEVIRFFPPVGSFVYRERSFGDGNSQAVYLSVQTAQCDPDAWGEDSDRFVLRPIREYAKLMVAWADPAVGHGEHKHNSRVCPGKDLSIVMITEMMKGFMKAIAPGTSGIEGGLPFDPQRWIVDKKPEDIKVNGYNISSVTFHKNRSGMILTDAQLDKLWYDESDTKFDKVNGFTKSFIALVKATIDPTVQESSSEVNIILNKKKFTNDYVMDFGNSKLRLINSDEESGNTDSHKSLSNFIRGIGLNLVKTFKFDDRMIWFDSVEEGIITMRKELLDNLPPQYNYWENLSSDKAISYICFKGVGQIYLDKADVTGWINEFHILNDAHYQVDLTYLGKYETRPAFVKYGHKAFFSKNRELLAIYSCNDDEIYTKYDSRWEHIKFAFKSSIVTDITLKHHLSNIHFIISNSMMIAARETLSKNHPLRRMLKVHYYRSSVINWAAKEILVPVKQLAHRTWGFTEKSWGELFNDIFAGWKYQTFPELIASKRIDVMKYPFYADGLLLWRSINDYVSNYLDNYYLESEEIENDPEIKDFWKHINGHINYGLPKLNIKNLINYLTDTIWWCTGGHEMAGSIVEYLIRPDGLMPKVVNGKTMADVQTFAETLIIICLTGMKQPMLMDDWSHLFNDEKGKKTVKLFRSDLKCVSKMIKSRNQNRKTKYQVMNPKVLEGSVSI